MRFHLPRLLLLLAAPAALAGDFGVTPIRLDFDAGVKTGAITISNDGDSSLSFQMKLFEWSQDREGKDQYADSDALIFFPRIMTIAAKDKGLIRVGTKSPLAASERSYRLFIEELPDAKSRGQGAQVEVKLRFGVPLFVAPLQPAVTGAIEALKLEKGELSLRVKNTGNRHFRFEKILVQAGDAVLGEVQGWYLLPGIDRAYKIPLKAEACAKAGALEISLKAEGLELKQRLDATPAQCGG